MATTRFILGMLCLVSALGYRLPDGNLLKTTKAQKEVLRIAQSQLGTLENGLNNHGTMVKRYLAYVHLKEGNPWCAAFVSWVFGQAGYRQPNTAWSPALFPLSKRTTLPQVADVLGIYSASKKRIIHCGLVENIKDDWVISIEGNTNLNGSSDGNGVYRKRRHRKMIAVFAHWLPTEVL